MKFLQLGVTGNLIKRNLLFPIALGTSGSQYILKMVVLN